MGSIAGLTRYPVKGMSGESLDELRFGWHGADGDRAFAFLRLCDTSGLPFLSPRRCPKLTAYSATTNTNGAVVTTPDGTEYDVRDPKLLHEIEEVAADRLHLVQLWSHATDSMDISLITTSSIETISRLSERALEPARFRANILVSTPCENRDHPEDRWVGRTLIGGTDNAMLHIARTTQRCTIVDIDPATGTADDGVFSLIRDHRKNRLGVYATVQRTGSFITGDTLAVHH